MTAGEELVAWYDPAGTVIGSVPRSRMRAQRLWHATTGVLVRSLDGSRVFVHRRTADKDVFPGMLDVWAGGVVAAGESPAVTAVRELAEEYGVSGVAVEPLFSGTYDLPDVRCHAFLYEARSNGPFVVQESEIESAWWEPVSRLRVLVDDPRWPIVPDGRIALKEWFALGPRES
ncbi:NUDIX domain-containing protein [Labedaea rhizosphaerae]|uniref:NUDIX domain-containing protein n=1 Tax=Labedaea rhizosphaerae TaxID=598644 RepID=UPI001FB67F4D|nr:NUDIX domain-containing protein [Labedaea rhizosphaerae]